MSSRGQSLLGGALVALASACVGSAGNVSDGVSGYDSRAGERESPGRFDERPTTTTETPSASVDAPGAVSGGAATGGLACSGTYRCTATSNGKSETSTVTLSQKDGECVLVDEDGDETVLAADGSVKSKGQTIGRWSPAGGGFSATAATVTVTCTR